MRTIHLYRFRHFDPLRRRWIMARYRCEAPEIRCRYPDFELIGRPEVRQVPDDPQAHAPRLLRVSSQVQPG